MTFLGRGTPRDRQKGAELIRQSKAKDFEFGESSLDAQKLVASLSPAACELFKWCKFGSDYDWLCQHLMAICLLGGFGVAKDQIRAVGILHELADEGREISEYWLGQCHKNGWGVVKNAQRAEIWYRRAAQHGNACAQFKLGESLYSGDGGAKNLPEAAEWFTKAAIQGNSDAQWNLGYCYENGLGVDQNSTACMTWYRRAAEQGHIKASTRIGLQTSLSFAWFGQR
ncbi:uncharacterized protein BJ171DRAFT_435056 [Polychytrium aggregatum]|uniref:uncharacterized protein n=1 Tax=Polychytrium aggregatum TaxID=110093 RepID=UPI0022FF4107|nr:uncharacterized protein BJ171DRAFT_435056 [Polychytrium aggregatum]KAI9190525.1 hypothetical protein BJ171DRAFT_435056 [Polychytrium aggregatum]